MKRFRGMVVGGRQVGRQLGFPTANVVIDGGEPGVYAARVSVDGECWNAMVNINAEGLLEAHLFDFEGDLYGRQIEVELLKFIRPEREFSSVEELRKAIEDDMVHIRALKC